MNELDEEVRTIAHARVPTNTQQTHTKRYRTNEENEIHEHNQVAYRKQAQRIAAPREETQLKEKTNQTETQTTMVVIVLVVVFVVVLICCLFWRLLLLVVAYLCKRTRTNHNQNSTKHNNTCTHKHQNRVFAGQKRALFTLAARREAARDAECEARQQSVCVIVSVRVRARE